MTLNCVSQVRYHKHLLPMSLAVHVRVSRIDSATGKHFLVTAFRRRTTGLQISGAFHCRYDRLLRVPVNITWALVRCSALGHFHIPVQHTQLRRGFTPEWSFSYADCCTGLWVQSTRQIGSFLWRSSSLSLRLKSLSWGYRERGGGGGGPLSGGPSLYPLTWGLRTAVVPILQRYIYVLFWGHSRWKFLFFRLIHR